MKKIIPLVSIIALPMVAMTAQANSGTISFEGEVTDSTCTVVVDGQSSDATIGLPTVSKNEFSVAGDKTGKTDFVIALTSCTLGGTPAETQVSAYFEAGPGVDVSTGNLINTGGATNVALLLSDGTKNEPIQAGKQLQTDDTNGNTYATVASGDATLPYFVEYIATDASVTAGSVESSVTYTLMYK